MTALASGKPSFSFKSTASSIIFNCISWRPPTKGRPCHRHALGGLSIASYNSNKNYY